MSADNGLILKDTGNGWELREYNASSDQTWEQMTPRGTFDSAEQALRASRQIYTEYGVSFAENEPSDAGFAQDGFEV